MEISFSVQAQPLSITQWLETARRAEDEGFERFYCADHPGSTVSPVPALAAAAAVTSRIRLGALVMNAGVHEPFDLAADVASLDLLSAGRAIFGVGAGHTPAEWAQVGRAHPSARDRVGRLLEVVEVVQRLLAGGPVTFAGEHIDLIALEGLSVPRHGEIPLLIGGNGSRVLRYAATHAEIISLSGLGRTLPDGHRHEVAWRPDQIDQRLDLIREATPAGKAPALEALVQHVQITDDALGAAAEWAGPLDVRPEDLLEAPYVLIGTVGEIASKIRRTAADRGIMAYAVRAPTMDDVALIRAELSS